MRVSTRTARFDLHGVRQQVVCIAGGAINHFLAKALVDKFNPAALTASSGGWPRAAVPDAWQQAAWRGALFGKAV